MSISANTVWEVRTAGSDSNGGGFVAGATGTDYSQQDSAQYSFSNLASSNGTSSTPSVTSASHTFVSADVGNIIQITAGTNWIKGFYQITSVSAGAAVLDRACGTSASLSSGTFAVGGALATPGKAGGAAVASNTIYIKAGTYTTNTSSANVSGGYMDVAGGTANSPTIIIGYNVTRGDLDNAYDFNNYPNIKNSASGDVTTIRFTNNNIHVRNLVVDGASVSSYGCYMPGNGLIMTNVLSVNHGSNGGFYINGTNIAYIRCYAKNNTGPGFNSTGTVVNYSGCIASGNGDSGFTTSSSTFPHYLRCISFSNTLDGFNTASPNLTSFVNCVCYNNVRDGIRITSAGILHVINSIFVINGGYGINATASSYADAIIDYNVFYNNTSGSNNSNISIGTNSVLLTGNPFVDASNGNFAVNNTAGQGAAARAIAIPHAFPGGLTTSYMDIGVAQHQDSGGSSSISIMVHPGMTGGMRG